MYSGIMTGVTRHELVAAFQFISHSLAIEMHIGLQFDTTTCIDRRATDVAH